MKQSLQIKLGQQLKMTSQLQQAIRLLQLSTLDLQQDIQEALDSNPMLEVAEEFKAETNSATGKNATKETNQAKEYKVEFIDHSEMDLADQWNDQIPDNLSIDFHWDDIYQPQNTNSNPSSDGVNDFDYKNTRPETLQDHLYWQLNMSSLVDSDRAIGLTIIDAIKPTGFLASPALNLFDAIKEELDIDFEEFEAVRKLVMNFDPHGVGSEDLQECLLFQLSLQSTGTAFLNDAKLILSKYLDLLGNHNYAQLKKKTKFKENRLKSAIELIQSLDPTPGAAIESSPTEYIVPDIFVKKIRGDWVIELNHDSSSRLTINQDYAGLVKRADNSEENNYFKNNLQNAKWFIKSLQSRNETLFKVASKIVEHQIGFLEYGEEAMKPLILHDIAESIEMHESTISRVTTRKYIHTPRGVFELKYFFSSHVNTQEGGECSSIAIRAIIKKLIQSEPPQNL